MSVFETLENWVRRIQQIQQLLDLQCHKNLGMICGTLFLFKHITIFFIRFDVELELLHSLVAVRDS